MERADMAGADMNWNTPWRGILVTLCGVLAWPVHAGEIGLQLYSLRHQLADNQPEAIAQVRAWGFQVVEGAGGLDPDGSRALKAQLDANGLTLVSVGTSFEELHDQPEAVVERARVFGAKLAMLAWIPHDGARGFTLEDAQDAVEVLNRAGALLAQQGITLQYHLHGYEFMPHGEGTLADYMITGVTDAQFQMDVFWIKQGGADPVALLQKYPGRFVSLHLKDREPGTPDSTDGQADDDSNVVLGSGDVGIAAVLEEARRQGIRYWFIEDESSRVLEQIPLSLEYLESLPH
jgi:sugar phosphate isomerase/epimerase